MRARPGLPRLTNAVDYGPCTQWPCGRVWRRRTHAFTHGNVCTGAPFYPAWAKPKSQQKSAHQDSRSIFSPMAVPTGGFCCDFARWCILPALPAVRTVLPSWELQGSLGITRTLSLSITSRPQSVQAERQRWEFLAQNTGAFFGAWPKIWAAWPKMVARVGCSWARNGGVTQGGRGGSPPQPFPCL